jgi:methylmalonyl-CoA/ethylmalonyl-CoA epimerase
MNPTHIEHIGIAVNSLEEAIPFYEKVFGLKCYNVEEVVLSRGLRLPFLW